MSPLLFKKACVVFISTKITGLKTVFSPWFPHSIFEHLIFKKLSIPTHLALGQIILRLFSEQLTGYMQSNPLGTAGSLRASGVNKRAHVQWWGRRDGPSQPGGHQQGVTWFNDPIRGAGPASWSLHIDSVVVLSQTLTAWYYLGL